MQPLFRALTAALAVGLLATGVLAGGTSASGEETQGASTPVVGAMTHGRAPASSDAIDWKPCAQDAKAECGTLRLPVDWARPGGETFDLAVARRAAADPDRRVGVLLVNPGGPGDSGVDFAVRRAPSHFSADTLSRFDIVGFDPRGVGGSRPVMCSSKLLAERPSSYPRNQAEFDQLARYNRTLREDCRRHTGPVFDHADTLSVVRDMDALRRALGERKINYFGHSYGTLIGQQYAEEYGDRIRAMALTANVDHSLGTLQFITSSAAAAEDSFQQFVKWCESTSSCALYGRDVTAVWDAVLARADRGEIRDPEHPDQPLTAHDITLSAFKAFYGPDRDELAALIAQLDSQKPGEEQKKPGEEQKKPRQQTDQVPPQQTQAAPFHAVFCQDWSMRPKNYREYAALTQAELQAAPHMRGTPRVHEGVAGCIGWPSRVNNPEHRLRITEAPKILLLHSRHDPANHFSWAANVHRQTRETTVLLPYEGAGHSVYGRNDCTRDAVDDYLAELILPAPGSHCESSA
ncbi:alpha/beta fold hydrolase [Streptomyces sp. NPDC001928]|uniref:alpha/beta fold hydrolase n=1 Tax=Streptomyces sp. NPDC001928 TaxID=3154404 RepID=UPI003320BF76